YDSSSAVPAKFEWLNPDLREHILPGEMIVLGDPNGMSCTQREADLMEIARQVNAEVRSLTLEEAQFVVNHYGLLELITSNASTGLGAGATIGGLGGGHLGEWSGEIVRELWVNE